MAVKCLIITGYGINCEEEVADCFSRAGGEALVMHLNHLIARPEILEDCEVLAIPGGFSFGDHISSGKNFANKIRFNLWDEFNAFIRSGKPVLGICNGFQILVKLGVLPDLGRESNPEFTFTDNRVASEKGRSHTRFEDRWVNLRSNPRNPSFWLRGIEEMELPVRHGEGRLVCPDGNRVRQLEESQQAALYYCDPETGEPTMDYPENPNGSLLGIAALTNPQGNVLGIMPHPEAYSLKEHYPNFLGGGDRILSDREAKSGFFKPQDGVGMIFFYNVLDHIGRVHDG